MPADRGRVEPSLPAVAVLGLGRMGGRLAATLVRQGFPTTVWNRTPGRASRLVAAGAVEESGAARAARHADVVVLALTDGDAVHDVLLAGEEPVVDQLRAGAVVVDLTTTGPRRARTTGAALARRGLRFVEAPVVGSLRPAAEGTLTTLTGGDPADVERVLPVLEAWSAPGRVVHMGEVGAANAAAIAVNTGLGIAAEGIGEALRLGADLRLDRGRLLEALRGGALGALVGAKEDMLVDGDTSVPHLTVDLLLKDLRLALYEASSALPATEAAYLQARLAAAKGRGDADLIEIALRREAARDSDPPAADGAGGGTPATTGAGTGDAAPGPATTRRQARERRDGAQPRT